MTDPGGRERRVVVLGLGNPLLADDGTGLVLLERLRAAGAWPDGVRLVDGGTWGLSLLPEIVDTDRLLVLDAVRAGGEPGAVLRGEGEAVPLLYRRPVSPHQIDLREVLATAALLGGMPRHLVVVGIQPRDTGDLRLGLSAPVESALDAATAEALRVLADWGARPAPPDPATAEPTPVPTVVPAAVPAAVWPACVTRRP